MAPYIRMETPSTSCRLLDGRRATTPELYQLWQVERLLERGDLARPWVCDLEAPARVEHGRWLVSCVNCETSVRVDPLWDVAYCAECGCTMRRILLPAAWRDIERMLLDRPRRETQSWLPGETLEQLEDQNREHGVAA